jgi:hypothetical protein
MADSSFKAPADHHPDPLRQEGRLFSVDKGDD